MRSIGLYLATGLAAVVIAACGGMEEELDHGPIKNFGLPIINGTPDTSDEHMAVVKINGCTATLIARDVVLTAGHCVGSSPPSNFYVRFGYTSSDYTHSLDVSETWVHPSYGNLNYDIAMLRLATLAPSEYAHIPILPHAIGITDDDIGQPLEFVGFGQTETGSSGVKLTGTNNLNWVCTQSGGCSIPGGTAYRNTICQDQTPSGICFGDSGGPAFKVRDGTEYVCGIASYVANQSCSGYGCHTKVDEYEAEIMAFINGSDGAYCTEDSWCQSGFCVDGVCCESNCPGACEACNLEGSLGQCLPVADDTPCPDGDVCNGDESCQAGTCSAGTPLDCVDGNLCTSDTCDPVSGCANPPEADGAPCPDADLCNGDETCLAGACQAGTPLACDDLNQCTADSCDPASGCQSAAVDDGTTCDGGPCGPADCQAGVCTASDPSVCENGDPCTDNSCDPASGCLYNPTADGTPCPDADLCNGDETCSAGVCQAGTALECDDQNPCTSDSCDAAGGCQQEKQEDGTACGEGPCGPLACASGVCAPSDPEYCDDDNPCTQDTCDAEAGCQHQPAADGTPCPDADLCDGDETCSAGVCQEGAALSCDDYNPCTSDSCDPALGCQYENVADGIACGGSLCGDLTCSAGVCTEAGEKVCDDDNPCTTDWCEPQNGCVNQPKPDGWECGECQECQAAECVEADCPSDGGCGCSQSSPAASGLSLFILALALILRRKTY